jgi:hypothetical protein
VGPTIPSQPSSHHWPRLQEKSSGEGVIQLQKDTQEEVRRLLTLSHNYACTDTNAGVFRCQARGNAMCQAWVEDAGSGVCLTSVSCKCWYFKIVPSSFQRVPGSHNRQDFCRILATRSRPSEYALLCGPSSSVRSQISCPGWRKCPVNISAKLTVNVGSTRTCDHDLVFVHSRQNARSTWAHLEAHNHCCT